MSRQRLRTGVLEASTRECPHCEGTGLVRTASSAGLSALRLLEEEAARGRVRSSWTPVSRKSSLPIVRSSGARSEEHTSELQSLMRISYAVFCLKKKKIN